MSEAHETCTSLLATESILLCHKGLLRWNNVYSSLAFRMPGDNGEIGIIGVELDARWASLQLGWRSVPLSK